jgi:hypothetical protein
MRNSKTGDRAVGSLSESFFRGTGMGVGGQGQSRWTARQLSFTMEFIFELPLGHRSKNKCLL